jgi:hypothetical protein
MSQKAIRCGEGSSRGTLIELPDRISNTAILRKLNRLRDLSVCHWAYLVIDGRRIEDRHLQDKENPRKLNPGV